MRVQQLEQFYKDGVGRLKEQMKRQEKERMEQMKRQIREEQHAFYEKKLQELRTADESRKQELRQIREELNRIGEQAVLLQKKIDGMVEQEVRK